MAHTISIAAAVRGTAPVEAYRDELDCSPPPYPSCERPVPAEFFYHVDSPAADPPAEDPPQYNFYDVERGSLIDIALAQYAQSISPGVASTRYSMLEQDEDAPQSASQGSGRVRDFLFYCMAIFCGVAWAIFWVCGIGYAIVISFQKVAESIV
jgi:hypothetical protein